MVILYLLGGIIGIICLIFVIGLILPAERVVSRKGHLNVSPEILYGIVTNNNNWQYRTSLQDLIIIETAEGMETWHEITKDGTVIRFQTTEKRPYSFYSFDMETNMFTGYWTGEFEPDGVGGTLFTATEYIRVKNPFVKTLSYLFFDVGKLMEEYQDDLRKKVSSMN
ncbi:MAG: SRPBCC family protein [Bacteroides sp.]|nr:SRPBCC family protein [Bacteroides sp.]